MPMGVEDERVGRPIVTSREPVGPSNVAKNRSVGDKAFMDALMIVIGAWLFLVFLFFSLRRHNV